MYRVHSSFPPEPTPKTKALVTVIFLCLAATACVSTANKQIRYLQVVEQRAQSGDLKAQLELATFYLNRNESTDRDSALTWFQTAADNGSGEGAFQSYKLLLPGTLEQRVQAFERLEQAADLGLPLAQLTLADALMDAAPEDKEFANKAFSLYREAAKQGLREAQSKLATMLFAGNGTERDLRASSQWFSRAANQGDSRAQLLLGDFYVLGLGVSEDLNSAISWYEKSAMQGDAEAQSKLGDLYTYDRFNAVRDIETGADWYQLAASNGVAHAQARIGKLYEDGVGVRRNIESAVRWYRRAADQGYALAQCHLGSLYHRGIGVTQDRIEADYWFDLAAAQIPTGVKPLIGFIHYDCSQFEFEAVTLSPELKTFETNEN